jgi:hypothetical protein
MVVFKVKNKKMVKTILILTLIISCGAEKEDRTYDQDIELPSPHCCHFIETVQSCSAWMGCYKVDHFSCQNLDTGEDCRAKRTHLRHATSDRIFSKPSGTCKGFEEEDFNNPCQHD